MKTTTVAALVIAAVTMTACGNCTNPPKFKEGQQVLSVIANKKGQVIRVFDSMCGDRENDPTYQVRFLDLITDRSDGTVVMHDYELKSAD